MLDFQLNSLQAGNISNKREITAHAMWFCGHHVPINSKSYLIYFNAICQHENKSIFLEALMFSSWHRGGGTEIFGPNEVVYERRRVSTCGR